MFAFNSRAAETVGHAYLQAPQGKETCGKTNVLIDPSQVSVVGPLDLNQSVASVAFTPSNTSVDDSFV